MAIVGVGSVRIVGGSLAIRVPAEVVRDERFPFVEGEEVIVTVSKKSNKKVVIVESSK